MSSPPLTSREYAYFTITGPSTHEAVTEKLGIEPSKAWNAGEPNPRTGRPQAKMRWSLSSGHDDTEPLQCHIESLLSWLTRCSEGLRSLWVDHDLTIVCVSYYPEHSNGAYLDRETIRRLAMLGIALDLDFYQVGDHGHEV